MSMTFIPLGVGDAFSALYYSSCLALEADGHWLLIDCPHPIRKMLREASSATELLDIDIFDAVVLTHLHADHCSGLEGFAFASLFALQRKTKLAVHPQIAADLWPHHLAAGMGAVLDPQTGDRTERDLKDFFEIQALSRSGQTRVGPFTIECHLTRHHLPTTALRIRAGHRCLGYSADTAFDPQLIRWLSEADLIIHETNYGPGHTPYAKLRELPGELRAKMRLIHYPDDFDLTGSAIEPLEQGRRYSV